jgi:hypothetical protein
MSKLKYIPTAKIVEILNSPNCTGVDGRDYGPVRHDLESILWERQSRPQDKVIEQYWQDYQDYLDSNQAEEA